MLCSLNLILIKVSGGWFSKL
ncbi:protein of unknown function (plasmid) [Cupriavidus taiwanensis]|uniref:Uncharacterized protein n=1 Tax=Cupriavidus taiwanensis TaxID=164546 RepID=A0A375IRR4_9BURK|nr:protein of unknown function [Cupriavidus taiwanensis]